MSLGAIRQGTGSSGMAGGKRRVIAAAETVIESRMIAYWFEAEECRPIRATRGRLLLVETLSLLLDLLLERTRDSGDVFSRSRAKEPLLFHEHSSKLAVLVCLAAFGSGAAPLHLVERNVAPPVLPGRKCKLRHKIPAFSPPLGRSLAELVRRRLSERRADAVGVQPRGCSLPVELSLAPRQRREPRRASGGRARRHARRRRQRARLAGGASRAELAGEG